MRLRSSPLLLLLAVAPLTIPGCGTPARGGSGGGEDGGSDPGADAGPDDPAIPDARPDAAPSDAGGGEEDAGPPSPLDEDAGRQPPGPVETTNYLVLTTDDLSEVAQEFADYRAETGYLTEVVTMSDLGVNTRSPRDVSLATRTRLALAWQALPEGAPLFLLLLGDAPDRRERSLGLIPAMPCDNLDGDDCDTDNVSGDLAGDGVPEAAVGRVPARTAAGARAYLDKLKDRDASYEVGLHNRRIVLYTGVPGFGEEVDAILEGLVLEGLRGLNHGFDVIGVYASPSSPYYYDPLEDKVIELFNAGALMTIYIGHGSADWSEGLPLERLDEIDIDHRLPFSFFFACSNGAYVGPEDSIAEASLWLPRGPVTTFASSDISHPYGNAILPYELQRVVLDERPATVGEAVLAVKRYTIERTDRFRSVIDISAGAAAGMDAEELETRRYQHLDLYNLFGDPAAPMLYPASEVRLDPGVEGRRRDGVLDVSGTAPGVDEGTAWVTLAADVNVILHELADVDPDDPHPPTVRANWDKATDKVVAGLEVPVQGGGFEAELTFASDLPRGDYYVKVYADDGTHDSFGSAPAPY